MTTRKSRAACPTSTPKCSRGEERKNPLNRNIELLHGKIGVAFHQRLRHRACCHSERKPPEISEQLSARLGGTAGNLHRKLLPFRRSRPHGRASEKSFGFGNCKETQKNSRSNNCPLASAVRLHRDSGKRKTFPHCRKLRRVGFCSHRKRDEAARLFAGNPAASDYG